MEPTNKNRARLAQIAVSAFAAETTQKPIWIRQSQEETEATISDLLANLMHLCNQNGMAFSILLDSARDNFGAELVEEAIKEADASLPTP